MTINRGYVANHKFWDQMGRITPVVEWSESHHPAVELTVAPWLPVGRYEKEFEYYIVVSNGKVVAETQEGHACPAGLRKAWNVAGATGILVYAAADVTEYTIDLTTGVAVTATVTYTETEVTTALRERGLIRHTERAMDFISKPVGVAPYNYYKAAGSDHYNPANLTQHNFRPQALVSLTCDYVLKYPVLPAVATAEVMANDNTGGAAGVLEDFFDGTTTPRVAGWFSSTQIAAVTRYGSVTAGDDVVGYMFVNYPVAYITAESPITPSVAGMTRQVESIALITAAGDYFVDYEAGMLFLYEADGDAIPSPWTALATITYYHYATTGTATNTVTTYACATGNLDYGDFLTYDANSNLVKATLDIGTAEGFDESGDPYAADPEYDSQATNSIISNQLEQAIDNHFFGIVGQVVGTDIQPRGYLDRVPSTYMGQTAANMRVPGTATGGRSDQLTYSNSAERMVIVNLILR